MKITIYELLGMVKDGKAPKRIIGKNSVGKKEEYIYNDFWYIHIFENPDGEEEYYYLNRDIKDLNNEVEIIEEEKELHANSVEFNMNNDKKDCVITLDENDLGIDKLHLDNCYFYKENDKWYVKKYDFKSFKLEEEKKIPEKLKTLNANVHSEEVYYENYSKEEISLDIETLQIWVNKIIDYLKSKGE